MSTLNITISWEPLWKAAREHSWKRGRLQAREDGAHTELQMGSDMDEDIAKGLMKDGVASLTEALHEFKPVATPLEGHWMLTLTMSDRYAETGTEAKIAQDYVLAFMMAGWSRDVDPERVKAWEEAQANAGVLLLRALHTKQKPVLT